MRATGDTEIEAGRQEYLLARHQLLARVPNAARPAMEMFLIEVWDPVASGGHRWAAHRLRAAANDPDLTAFDPGIVFGIPPTHEQYALTQAAFREWAEHRGARWDAVRNAPVLSRLSAVRWVNRTARSSVGVRNSQGQRRTRSANSGGGGGSGPGDDGEPSEPPPAPRRGHDGGYRRSLPAEVERGPRRPAGRFGWCAMRARPEGEALTATVVDLADITAATMALQPRLVASLGEQGER